MATHRVRPSWMPPLRPLGKSHNFDQYKRPADRWLDGVLHIFNYAKSPCDHQGINFVLTAWPKKIGVSQLTLLSAALQPPSSWVQAFSWPIVRQSFVHFQLRKSQCNYQGINFMLTAFYPPQLARLPILMCLPDTRPFSSLSLTSNATISVSRAPPPTIRTAIAEKNFHFTCKLQTWRLWEKFPTCAS